MLIVINYSHSGFPWRIKSHEELKEMAFFCFLFFYVGEAVIPVCFNCAGFHVLVRSKGKGDILTAGGPQSCSKPRFNSHTNFFR